MANKTGYIDDKWLAKLGILMINVYTCYHIWHTWIDLGYILETLWHLGDLCCRRFRCQAEFWVRQFPAGRPISANFRGHPQVFFWVISVSSAGESPQCANKKKVCLDVCRWFVADKFPSSCYNCRQFPSYITHMVVSWNGGTPSHHPSLGFFPT